ncbi:MAG: nicotinamide mononucleotide transporter [Bacteroidales bacterium]|nr:nicotinamide mononucleotide transporter [Bacteroidales bacterium]
MNYELIIELIAVATGLLSVWFSKRINILVFPIGIISVLLYVFLFIKNGLFANAIINFLYFAISVFGWWNWKKQRTTEVLRVTNLNKKESVIIGFSWSVALFLIIMFAPKDISIRLDYLTSILGLIAMCLTSIKKVENWIFYIAADIILIPLCIYKGLYLTSLQYIVYTILAIMGYISWNKEAKKNV